MSVCGAFFVIANALHPFSILDFENFIRSVPLVLKWSLQPGYFANHEMGTTISRP
jgi:hypothetical protein